MANLPKGALRGVKRALKEQGTGPQRQKMSDFGAKQVQAKGDRPTRLRSYNVKVHDLVEFRVREGEPWQTGQVVGINQIRDPWNDATETTYHILGPEGLGLQNIYGRNVRMIVRLEDE